jgi:DNA repair photolyase
MGSGFSLTQNKCSLFVLFVVECRMTAYKVPKTTTFHAPVTARGAGENPSGRFEKLDMVTDAETFEALREIGEEGDETRIPTQIFRDTSKSVVSTNDSPDLGMEASLNTYRGCEHGCIYCYARPTHEYLGLSAGLDFESKIFTKPEAAALLRKTLGAKSWKPKPIMMSGVTDCYQPVERRLKITRSCLEVLRDFANPASIVTKNYLVTRDIDIFKDMAREQTISVNLSITTLDPELAGVMEPRASRPAARLKAVEMLARENIPVGIMMGPILPGLTEHEIPSILKAASEAGARSANFTILRLPYGVKDLFENWLRRHYPERADKILNRLREMYGGKLYDSAFGVRGRGTGVHADHIAKMFSVYRQRYGLNRRTPLSVESFRRRAEQLTFF